MKTTRVNLIIKLVSIFALIVAVAGCGSSGSSNSVSSNRQYTGSWTLRASASPGTYGEGGLFDVTYSSGQFVAVGVAFTVNTSYGIVTWSDIIQTSPDGITWTSHVLPAGTSGTSIAESAGLNGVTYGNGQFVAVGTSYNVNGNGSDTWSDVILTSPDGITWTSRALPSDGTSGKDSDLTSGILEGVTYGNGQFVAVGGYWTTTSGANNTTINTWSDVILTSPDGITWTSAALPSGTSGTSTNSSVTEAGLYGVTYGNGQFVAVGEYLITTSGANNSTTTTWSDVILTSPDGSTWTSRALPSGTSGTSANSSVTDTGLYGVTYGKGQFVAVGGSFNYNNNGSNTVILTSPDGITWTSPVLPSGMFGSGINGAYLVNVIYGNGYFVAPGCYYTANNSSGTWNWTDVIVTSPDGITWTSAALPSGTSGTDSPAINQLDSVAYNSGTFVVVGNLGQILTSP